MSFEVAAVLNYNVHNLPVRPTRQERVSDRAQKPPQGGFCICGTAEGAFDCARGNRYEVFTITPDNPGNPDRLAPPTACST
jgi:hypothetical protein